MVLLQVFLIQVRSIFSVMGVVLTLSTALLACTFSPSQLPAMSSEHSPQSGVALKNSAWRLDRWERQGSTVALVPQTKVSLHFESNQVHGFGGCNRFSGFFKLVDQQISLEPLQSTQRGCAPVIMNQETQFLSALQAAHCITLDAAGRVALSYSLNAEEGVLYFAPISSSD